jgi:hypothetical protein
MVRYGKGSYCGIGVVSGYTTDGTASSMEDHFRIDDGAAQLKLEQELMTFPDLSQYDETIESKRAGQQHISGSLTVRPTFEQLHRLLRWITGHAPAPSGSDPYLYAFVPADPTGSAHYLFGSVDRHLVVELYRGDSSGRSVFYQGLVPTEVQLRFEPNAFLEVTINFIGRGYTVGPKSASPSFGSDYAKCPTGQAAGSFLRMGSYGGETGYRCSSATMTITEPREHRWDVIDVNPSVIPAISGPREVMLSVEVESDGTLDNDETLLQLIGDPVTNRIPSALLTLQKSASRSMVMQLYECVVQPGAEPQISGHGLIKLNLELKAHCSATYPTAYIASCQNGQAAF